MKKLIAILLCAVMVCAVLASCKGSSTDESSSYTVKLTIKNGDEVLHGPENVTMEATEEDFPTVLDVILQYVADSDGEITCETASRTLAGKTSTEIISIDSAKKDSSVFWQVLINNKTANINADIEDGDDIVFFLDKNADVSETETEAITTAEVQTANDDFNG